MPAETVVPIPPPAPQPDMALTYLVLDGPDAAGSILGVSDKVACRARRPSRLHLVSGSDRPIGPARKSRSGEWSGRRRKASMPTRPVPPTSWRSTTLGAGCCSPGRQPSPSSAPSTRPSGSIPGPRSAPTGSASLQARPGRFRGEPSRSSRTSSSRSTSISTPPQDGLLPWGDRQGRPHRPIPVWSPARRSPRRGRASRRPDRPGHDRRLRQVPRRVPDRGLRRGAGPPDRRPTAW